MHDLEIGWLSLHWISGVNSSMFSFIDYKSFWRIVTCFGKSKQHFCLNNFTMDMMFDVYGMQGKDAQKDRS